MTKRSPFRYFRTSPEIIRLAVMLYVRFPLSLRNVEDLLHERGIEIVHRPCSGYHRGMNIPTHMPGLKGFRYPREIIAYAVWAYHRLALSTADVEDLLAARGVVVSGEAIRLWVNRFGRHFADCIRRDRPRPNDKWHLDEVVITIRGKKYWLWRAIDANGDVLDVLVQTRRNAKATKRFFQRLVSQFGEPRVVITDKLRSYV